MKKKIISVSILASFLLVILAGCSLKIDTPIKEFNLDEPLKVGIISDSQLPPKEKDDDGKFRNNLINALEGLKAQGINMLIFAGDIGDEASNYTYDTFNNAISSVFGDKKPITQFIMGNHDYWGCNDGMLTQSSYRKRFEEKLNQSPFTHYKVNGYHFIGASPSSGSMDKGYSKILSWLDSEISKAVKDDPNKPVFVITHNSAKDTVYGSDDWGDKELYDIFKKYEQVVSISGHLHYSIMDERAIHQKDFTSFSTQSVSYTELEEGKENGTIPPKAEFTPMGLVMEFGADKIDIKRMNFKDKNNPIEEKSDMRWTLPIPLSKDKFTYTKENALAKNTAPSMVSDNGNSIVDGEKTFIEFKAGVDNDFVHSYKLVWSDNTESYYFSDFINGISSMSNNVKLQIFGKKAGTYSVKVYAIDSYGLVSKNYVKIDNVKIVKEMKYQQNSYH